jgi:hypothetical protein
MGATATRNCQWEEGEHGLIVNSKTGKPYDVTRDPCVERGPHLGYNEAGQPRLVKPSKSF